MKKITIYHYDAFSNKKNMGNPAGIVLNADKLSEQEMLEIAKFVGFNETAFVLDSDIADLKIKYFTPGHEMNLCGHATIASIYCLCSKGLLSNREKIKIETNAGILDIVISYIDKDIFITMEQNSPSFIPFEGNITRLAQVLGIETSDIDSDYPIVYASTGIWTLLVPVKYLGAFTKMEAKNSLFPSVLTQMPNCSIHPFCFETFQKNRDIHSRHFSSAYSGTIEDPVTGTASGAIGAYYASYVLPTEEHLKLIIEQGQEINRNGKVFVFIDNKNKNMKIEIAGTAVYIKEFIYEIKNI